MTNRLDMSSLYYFHFGYFLSKFNPNKPFFSPGTLCPDPECDKVEAIFLHVYHDTAAKETTQYVLVSLDSACQQVPVFTVTGAPVRVVQCVTESFMFEELVRIVRRWVLPTGHNHLL